jgi:hypothetical protein
LDYWTPPRACLFPHPVSMFMSMPGVHLMPNVNVHECAHVILLLFPYHEDGSNKLNACNWFYLCVWFIFNLNSRYCYAKNIYYSVYTWDVAHVNPAPCFLLPALFTYNPFLLTWRTSFLAPGANTHPLLSLVCYQLLTLCYFAHPDTPHRSGYNIYINDINNISRPVWYNYFLSLFLSSGWSRKSI